MSNPDPLETDTDGSLKGKEFDEACRLVADDENTKVFVHLKPEGSGRWDFCFSFVPGEYDEAALLEMLFLDYGAGEYPVQVRTLAEGGQHRIRWQKNMRVAARRRSSFATQQPPAAPASSGNEALARAIDNQTRLLTALLEKVSQPVPETKTAADFAKDLAVMKDLFGSDNRQSPLEMIKESLELQKLLLDASGGDSDPLTQAIKTLGPKIVEGIEALQRQPVRAAPRPAAASEPTSTAQPGELEQPVFAHIDTDAAFAIFAENYLGRLLALPFESSPEDVGRYLARVVGDHAQLLHVVGLVITQDDMIERLAAFNADVMKRADWLDAVADWLAHALWPDTNGPPTPENATKNATLDENGDSRGIKTGKDESGETADDAHGTGPPERELDNDA